MTWNDRARSRRRDWERKRALKAVTVTIELDMSRWEAAVERARQDGLPTRGLEAYWSLGPELQRGAVVTSCINDLRADMLHYPHVHQTTVPQTGREFGELMRMALGERADQPEGPPYIHTYTMPPTNYPDLEETLSLWKRLCRWILSSRLVGE